MAAASEPIPGDGGPDAGELVVDHENAGAGLIVDFALVVGAASHPPSATVLFLVVGRELLYFPVTSLSKSSSSAPPGGAEWKAAGRSPKDMKSALLSFMLGTLPLSSASLLECSCSTLEPRLLISSMNCWNCLRSRSGPNAMAQRSGMISNAMKSVSASVPACLRTLSAASITAGSFVFIPLISGTIFSCMVYLSSTLMADFAFLSWVKPERPSSVGVGGRDADPPQRVTKASRPRTLMPREEVFEKTEAMTGKSSFLMVVKSSTGRTICKERKAASTIEWIGDSIAS